MPATDSSSGCDTLDFPPKSWSLKLNNYICSLLTTCPAEDQNHIFCFFPVDANIPPFVCPAHWTLEYFKQRFSAIAWAPESRGGGGRGGVRNLLNTSQLILICTGIEITAKQPLPLREESSVIFMSFSWLGIFIMALKNNLAIK